MYNRRIFFVVFQEYANAVKAVLVYFLEVLDKPFGFQDLHDFQLEFGGGNVNLFMAGHYRIPDLGKHICYGI